MAARAVVSPTAAVQCSQTSCRTQAGPSAKLAGRQLTSNIRSSAIRASTSGRRVAKVQCAATAPPSQESAFEFDFGSYMKTRAMEMEAALDESIPLHYPEVISESMRYALLGGGKRIRPALCLAACEMVGGTKEVALPTACALEMIHTMSLIHDDLPAMDNDDFRRGKPTVHKVYGDDMAILSGDAMLTRAFEYIARATKGVPAERVLRVVADVAKAVGSEGLVGGQAVDLMMEGGGESQTLATLEYIHAHKTGALLEAAVVSGAVLGGATEPEIDKLRKYALDIGLAFQVIDDILDVTKTTEELGKTAAKDLEADKTTYPKLFGLERSKEIADNLIAGAKAQLSDYPVEKAAPLLALADYIGSRQN
mmetsp:Transcript_9190/g.26324  ORF Transcript_9190/g.26324 Transcript_9190/m.26324 type:complete len:367 (-) Transcript_9190:514-1614(-)|eukprot:CAMPEP_0117679016 /NCGR_PEP_ID=MMETSP0804-20121206/17601_1 /TAXON_ID=1074897 /ORGANISM="Tetraselmis astigmatica, Strain CCMP880" /LENGTH=366 /DNA_ID=CAMNT_0005488433 /DNA_START=77 /DNA_END=1177 /DNA_ORIENTATION=-